MNVFAFAGNITKDIELKTTTGGKKVASFGIAINEGKDKTTFLNCVAWEKTAELLEQYCSKGDRLSGSGRIEVRSWEHEGQKRYATEVIISQFDFPPKAKGELPAQEAPKSSKGGQDFDSDSIPFRQLNEIEAFNG